MHNCEIEEQKNSRKKKRLLIFFSSNFANRGPNWVHVHGSPTTMLGCGRSTQIEAHFVLIVLRGPVICAPSPRSIFVKQFLGAKDMLPLQIELEGGNDGKNLSSICANCSSRSHNLCPLTSLNIYKMSLRAIEIT